MEMNLKYAMALLGVLGLSAADVYVVSVYPTCIRIQGKYKAELVKRIELVHHIDNNGYISYEGTAQVPVEDDGVMNIQFEIALTD